MELAVADGDRHAHQRAGLVRDVRISTSHTQVVRPRCFGTATAGSCRPRRPAAGTTCGWTAPRRTCPRPRPARSRRRRSTRPSPRTRRRGPDRPAGAGRRRCPRARASRRPSAWSTCEAVERVEARCVHVRGVLPSGRGYPAPPLAFGPREPGRPRTRSTCRGAVGPAAGSLATRTSRRCWGSRPRRCASAPTAGWSASRRPRASIRPTAPRSPTTCSASSPCPGARRRVAAARLRGRPHLGAGRRRRAGRRRPLVAARGPQRPAAAEPRHARAGAVASITFDAPVVADPVVTEHAAAEEPAPTRARPRPRREAAPVADFGFDAEPEPEPLPDEDDARDAHEPPRRRAADRRPRHLRGRPDRLARHPR